MILSTVTILLHRADHGNEYYHDDIEKCTDVPKSETFVYSTKITVATYSNSLEYKVQVLALCTYSEIDLQIQKVHGPRLIRISFHYRDFSKIP